MSEMKWRFYEERDKEAVETIHAQMENRVGRKLDLPDLFEEPVIVAVVLEIDGVVTDCIFAEAEAEVCATSSTVLSPEKLQGAIDLMMPVLKGYRLQIARAFVPTRLLTQRKNRPAAIERLLNAIGFTKENESVTQFFKWL